MQVIKEHGGTHCIVDLYITRTKPHEVLSKVSLAQRQVSGDSMYSDPERMITQSL